jgi:hypothetical protein
MVDTGAQKAQQAYVLSFFKAWMAGWMVRERERERE